MAVKNFRSQRPRLLECGIFAKGTKLVIENHSSGGELIMPLDRGPLLDLLDGTHSLKEILSSLYSAAHSAHKSPLGLRSVFLTLQDLSEHGLLADFDPLGIDIQDTENYFDLEKQNFFQVFYKKILFKKMLFTRKSPPVFYAFASAIVLIATLFLLRFRLMGVAEPFLRFSETYSWSIPICFLLTSAMLTIKTALKSILIFLGTGCLYRLEFKLKWFAFYLSISDHGIFHSNKQSLIVTYHVATLFMYFFAAGIITILLPHLPHEGTVFPLAVLLTLFETHPYHRSDLSKIFSVFCGETQIRHLIPYLKRRSLVSLFIRPGKIAGERIYLIFSIVALTWITTTLTYSMKMLSQNLPILTSHWLQASFLDFMSRAILLFTMVLLTIYAASDIVMTVVDSLIRPLFSPLVFYIRGIFRSRTFPAKENQKAINALNDIVGFEKIDQEGKLFLIENSAVNYFRKKTKLINQGKIGQELFVLLNGSVNVIRRETTGLKVQVAQLHAPAVFGEVGVVLDTERTADVIATTDIEVLVVTKKIFSEMLQRTNNESDRKAIVDKFSLGHLLTTSALFSQLPSEALHMFANQGTLESHPVGQKILTEGDISKSFYLLLQGTVAVLKSGKKVASLNVGDFFGEIALIADVPRTATIQSESDCVVLRLDQDDFWNVLSSHPQVAMSLEAVAENRIEESKCSA